MDKENIRYKVLSILGIIILGIFIISGFFAIPIGITVCSAIGLVYSIKYKDNVFFKSSIIALIIGIMSIVYTILTIKSM